MAFGQASGPPASARQIQELTELLEARGFDSFKEARHPFGLTQRQAGGKFTVDEVTQLIDQLSVDAESGGGTDAPATAAPSSAAAPAPRRADSDRVAARALRRQEDAVVELLSEVMATELTNRGWCCIPPPDDASS
ncbi:MAG: hypothetical protein M3Y51_04120 [Actinomycetota bacterium]|nr:hypothetical protein [Actinomycetota bacterium]